MGQEDGTHARGALSIVGMGTVTTGGGYVVQDIISLQKPKAKEQDRDDTFERV